ncbi:protoporphyrinogen oxidase [Nocardioides baekrokdamisoli]|uniref:Protoporphyrinogen oxidase n=1 Tax=Nocardioides baekrokdamisoli TaxID=1804624 RepID=A0A3G9II94_9ACTN|nr:FAD-dependent oxidoreductase [Nocardioides baekrokdamisoli]BBH17942.1 protoporphyrinogen oxidase [Nocardioides baekrokdamisoli]
MRIAVVGAGIGGLVAAHDLVAAGHSVVVLEASDRAGGKLRRESVAGAMVDVGAEAMLARRPEGVALAESLGLPIVHPTDASSRIWTRDALRPMPPSVMGAPTDLAALAASGVLSSAGLARAQAAVEVWPDEDVTVGDLVAARFGDEVTDRLVEPLLGGVYAGRARQISARAATPQLLVSTGSTSTSPTVTGSGPVFAGLVGGMGQLAEALADRLDVRLQTPALLLERSGAGWLVDGEAYDAVVVATPAGPAAALLRQILPTAADELAAIESASVAVVTFAFDSFVIDNSSGFLVPPIDGRAIKASTFSFNKWDWVREAGDGLSLLRTSLGRAGETLSGSDLDLIDASLADLERAVGGVGRVVDVHVQRWDDALPQYALGHLERVARIREAVAGIPGLAVCGAAYDGVGIPAVIASARLAANSLTCE